MRVVLVVVAVFIAITGSAWAQDKILPPPAKTDREPVQHGAQPNPQEVRPGTAEGDHPSAAAGSIAPRAERRIFGLPVTGALVIGGVLVALLVLAGIVIPAARRRDRARGGGTYGRL